MTAIIIEDEIPAAIRLSKLLTLKGFVVLNTVHSIKNAIIWLKENNHPDLVFMDVKLRDGNCFEILEAVKVKSKIVFTTAFDEFALNAFNYNSIDYLLKPLNEIKLNKLITKIDALKIGFTNVNNVVYLNEKENYKTSHLVAIGNTLKKIEVSDILFLYSENNSSYIYTSDDRSFLVGKSLDKLEQEINPDLFYRISRKFIVSKAHIVTINNSKKEIFLSKKIPMQLIISKLKYKSFLEWYKE